MKASLLPGLCCMTVLAGACGDPYRVVKDRSLERGAEVTLGDFKRQAISTAGIRLWDLSGRQAYVFEKKGAQNRVVAYKFRFRQYDKTGRRIAQVDAVRGEVSYTRKTLYLTGKVVFVSGVGRTITSEKMEYNWEKKLLESDAPVTIVERGLYTHCKGGIRVEKQNERQVCKGPAGSATGGGGGGSRGKGSGLDNVFQ